MSKIDKIGIIQNAPLTADLSNNLRHIVQGYRECVDHGADLVVASACALCGPEVQDLRHRNSFLEQVESALDALSHELCGAPLILAAYTPVAPTAEDLSLDDMIDELEATDEDGNTLACMVPYLLEKDCVTELTETEVVTVRGTRIYIDMENEEVLPDFEPYDILIHLCTTPWHAALTHQEADSRLWEASHLGVPVVNVHGVGTAEENIYGGGSGIYMPGKRTLLRLPFFRESAKVASLSGGGKALALPESVELLAEALECGIRDTVTNNGYTGVCVPLDHPNSAVLATLCVHALGSSHVLGVTFQGNTALADKLGIESKSIPLDELIKASASACGIDACAPLAERLQGTMLSTLADTRWLMLMSPLDRAAFMTGAFTLYGETCGYLAPLGNLYSMDLHLLSRYFSERHADIFGAITEPENPGKDRIIHELADRNTSPSALIYNASPLFKEEEVRAIQRKLVTSALKRSQFPIVLRVDRPEERLQFPVCHRLND